MIKQLRMTLAVLACAAQVALAADIEFSAETYQKSPQGVEQQGLIYVGRGQMRTETAEGPQQVIQIVDKKQGKQWLLFPGKTSYSEAATPPLPDASQSAEPINPCGGVPGSHCEMLGEEDLSGRAATKWKMTVNRRGQTETITQWIDKARGIPLRSEMSSGQRMEMRMVGPDNLAGRPVEKWEMVMWGANQQTPQRSYQWYDQQLELVIREELPGGFVRELKNIRVGPQPGSLFQLPAGWKRVQGPSGGAQ